MASLTMSQLVLPLMLICASLFEASPLPTRQLDGFLHLPIARTEPSALQKRQDVDVSIRNDVTSYEVQLSVGTPPQAVTLLLDTGSSDIWVHGAGNCTTCHGGSYNPKASKTEQADPEIGAFSIEYFDGSSASGYYVTDTVGIGSATVKDVVVAVATKDSDTTYTYGTMGIGLDNLESTENVYPGLLDQMKAQGTIGTRAYSLYLDDLSSNSGALIFGGIDKAKYKGNLVPLPIIPSSDNAARLSINWTSVSITNSSGKTEKFHPTILPYPVVLDSGYTNSVLPTGLFNHFVSYFGAFQDSSGLWKVNCNLGSGSINFGFGDGAVAISVPFSEIALPNVFDNSGNCAFGFQAADATNSVISFGDTFLRSAYAVYNYDDMTISLAQAKYDTANSQIVPI